MRDGRWLRPVTATGTSTSTVPLRSKRRVIVTYSPVPSGAVRPCRTKPADSPVLPDAGTSTPPGLPSWVSTTSAAPGELASISRSGWLPVLVIASTPGACPPTGWIRPPAGGSTDTLRTDRAPTLTLDASPALRVW